MKPEPFVAVFAAALCLARPSVAMEPDACDQVLEQACLAPLIQDPTGESSGSPQGPLGYIEAKKAAGALLAGQVQALAATPEWKAIVGFAKQPPSAFGRRLRFQQPALEIQLASACPADPDDPRCIRAVVELIVSEIQFNLFAGIDLLYRKGNVRGHESYTLYSETSFTSPPSAEQLDGIRIGTQVKSWLLQEFERSFPALREIRRNAISAIFPQLLPDRVHLQRMQDQIVPDTRAMMLEFISEQPEGSAAYQRLKTVGFDPVDFDSIRNQDNLFPAVVANAQYNPITHSFQFLPGFVFHNTSTFGQVFVVAHELAHSVDPCVFGPPVEGKFWLPKVVSCLRNQVGVEDRTRVKGAQSPRHCSLDDQLGESASDFIAAEILGRYLIRKWSSLAPEMRVLSVAQALRPFRCDHLPNPDDPHLRIKERYRRIILANPKIREFLRCRKKSPYTCGGGSQARSPHSAFSSS